jgi:starvation-inducible DNA-binding protein
MKSIQIGLDEKNRFGSAEVLNKLLSDEYVLYTKTRNYHWNVTGKDFSQLHKFFEEQYTQLDEIVDSVAERVRQVGFFAFGSLEQFSKFARLKEHVGDIPPAEQMIASLIQDHETIIRCLRDDLRTTNEKYNDAGTSDFLTGLMEQHEKMAWMLRAHLQ